MELFKNLLAKVFENEEIQVVLPNLKFDTAAEIVESESHKALQKIKALAENESLSDFDCIEEIVIVLGKRPQWQNPSITSAKTNL